MPLFQRIIRSDLADPSDRGMESWLRSCIGFVAEVTGLEITYKKIAKLQNNTGFTVNIHVPNAFIREFGIIMSTSEKSSNYLSSVVFDGQLFPLNSYGNFFDHSSRYASDVLVLFSDDILHVLVRLPDNKYHTLFLLNKMTEIATGNEFFGCLGLVSTDGKNLFCSQLTRNDHDDPYAVSGKIKIANAETFDGRFRLNALYSFKLPSGCKVPDLKPFSVVYSDGKERSALIPGTDRILDRHGRTVSGGRFICFI